MSEYARHVLGTWAEQTAAEMLAARPEVRILARNFRTKGGEIDLILEERADGAAIELVFVEVRARTHGGWVDPVSSVVGRKRHRIERAAAVFLLRYRGSARGVRFDVMAWDGSSWEHLRGAW